MPVTEIDLGGVPEDAPAPRGVGGWFRPAPRRGRPRKGPPPLTKENLESSFFWGFRGVERVLNAEDRIAQDECTDMAAAYKPLADMYPRLRFIIILLGPFAIIGEVFDKLGRLWGSRRRFRPRVRTPNVVDAVPDDVSQTDDNEFPTAAFHAR